MLKIEKSNYILQEGPIAEINGVISEISYEKIAKLKEQNFALKQQGWLGITDKYWLSSIIPDSKFEYELLGDLHPDEILLKA